MSFKRQKLGVRYFLSAGLLLIAFSPRLGFSSINTELNISSFFYSVSGNAERSFFPSSATRFLYEGRVSFSENLKSAGDILEGAISYRLTDNNLIDPKYSSLEELYLKYHSKNKEFILGDYVAGLSEYSINNALRGLKLGLQLGKTSKIIILGGVDTADWENVWGSKNRQGSNRRYVEGVRYEKSLFKDKALILGFNYGSARDDAASLSENDTAKKIQVISSDLKYQLNKSLVFSGEFAKSISSIKHGSEVDFKNKWDTAYKISTQIIKDKYSGFISYSRIGPHFETTGGFASQDLETFQVSNNFTFLKNANCSAYFLWTRDNLNKAKDTTTKNHNPGISFTIPLKGSYSLILGWDGRFIRESPSRSRESTLNVGINKAFKSWAWYLNYSHMTLRDTAQDADERNRSSLSCGLNGNFRLGKTNILWNLGENASVDKNITDGKSDVVTGTSAAIDANFPHNFSVRANVNLLNNNFYKDENDSNQHTYELSIRKSVKDKVVFSLSYYYNDNNFTGEANDYCEKRLIASMKLKF